METSFLGMQIVWISLHSQINHIFLPDAQLDFGVGAAVAAEVTSVVAAAGIAVVAVAAVFVAAVASSAGEVLS